MAQTPRPADAVGIGQVFLGKYRVERILGQGGMGVVAECTHLALNERVALKMLRQDVLLDPDAVERFMREAQAAVKLRSEYVARVSDVGTLENGTPYMVMEYLDGMDLGQMLGERGSLPVPWAATLMLQTAEALAEAHSIGIVHRDVKPTNLFVTWRPDGTALIKVLDFGISKSFAATDMHLTQTQSLLGTPAYMSPEQMRSARLVDARTDIWSLGSVMYELLEGRRPFEAESFSEMCVKVAVDPPTPMTNTPPELAAVVMRCLAKTPEQRYPSMAELGRDLIPFAQDPHQATMLVERMQRMLRRGGAEFDNPTTGVGIRALPPGGNTPARLMTPVPWHGGSDASGRVRTPAGGVPLQYTGAEVSAPVHAASQTQQAPRQGKKSRLGMLLVVMVLIGAGAGIGVALNARGDEPVAPKTTTASDSKVLTPPAKTPTTTPPEVKTPEVKVAPPPVVDKTAEVKTPEVKTPEVKTDVEIKLPQPGDKTVGATTKKHPPTSKIKQPPGVAGVKKEPNAGKEVKQPDKTPVAPPCNAFDHPHGCPNAK